MKIPSDKTPVLREWPNAMQPFMRFQYGFNFPKIVTGCDIFHREFRAAVDVFHLCGFGETEDQAARMAGLKILNQQEAQ